MSPSLARALALGLALATALAPVRARAQAPAPLVPPDSQHQQVLELRDGSSVVGRVVAADGDTVRFATRYGTLALPRQAIQDVKLVPVSQSAEHGGEYWPADPNASRLILGPTGRTLEEGDSYFSDTYLLLLGFNRGLSDRLTMGGGFSIVPSTDPTKNVAYLAPKLSVVRRPTLNVAVGAYAGIAPIEDGKATTGGVFYGVGTFGPVDRNLSLGAGWGFANGDVANRPVVMLGLHDRFAKRTAFVSENYLLPGADNVLVSYGLRFFGEKMAVDLAFWNMPGDNMIFPGVPYVSFVSHF